MKVIIYKTKIEVIVNSIDSIPALLEEVAESIRRENIEGMLIKEDSDFIKWETNISKREIK
jgi:hypothetical protein